MSNPTTLYAGVSVVLAASLWYTAINVARARDWPKLWAWSESFAIAGALLTYPLYLDVAFQLQASLLVPLERPYLWALRTPLMAGAFVGGVGILGKLYLGYEGVLNPPDGIDEYREFGIWDKISATAETSDD